MALIIREEILRDIENQILELEFDEKDFSYNLGLKTAYNIVASARIVSSDNNPTFYEA